jgi:hypothetical protein
MKTTLDMSNILTPTTTTFDASGTCEYEVAHTSSREYEFQEEGPKAFASPVLLDQSF